MKRSLLLITFAAASFLVLPAGAPDVAAQAQQPATTTTNSSNASGRVDVERIIRAFTAKESEFRQALNNYSFKRDAIIQTLGLGGQISGEYRRTSRFVFDDNGNRFEKIIFFPMPTITEIGVTAEDLEDLGGIQPFALEASKAHLYNFNYVGKERIDEINTYIFDVAPKVMPDPKKTKERVFVGRIWVDDQDLQIVKARGKGMPEDKNNKYATFETYREQIDGRYWFPTYTYADDELVFDSGLVVRLRMRVRYSDFERLAGKVRIIEEGEPGVVEEPEKPATPTATPKPTPKP